MIHARFESLGVHLPDTVTSTGDLVNRMRKPPEFDLETLTGVRNRRTHDTRPDSYEDSFVLATKAAAECLARSRYRAADLDVVISASITRVKDRSRFHFEPSLASMLARSLGAGSAIHFDVSNACAGMLTGVLVLERMIASGVVRNGMVVSGEQITPLADTAVREIAGARDPQFASLTVGDSAAAVVLDRSDDDADRIHYVDLATFSDHAQLCIAMPSERGPGFAMYTDNSRMQSRERLDWWPAFYDSVLTRRGTTFDREGFDHVIHHQVGSRFVDAMNRAGEEFFGRPMPDSPRTVEQYGNTSSTSHFVVLHEQVKAGRLRRGAKVLLVAAASGVVTGCLSATISSLEV